MKIPVEYLQVHLLAPSAPSALRLWLDLFDGQEPTHSATDEDGDTSARGPRNGYWIDIHRVDDTVNFFATPVERRSSHDSHVAFPADAWQSVLNEVILRAELVAATVDVERLGINIVCGQPYSSNREAIAAYRDLGGAFSHLPPQAMEARYDFAVPRKSEVLDGFGLRLSSQYRVGRRAVADPEGNYEASDGTIVSWQANFAHVINVATRTKSDTTLTLEQISPGYRELALRATEIWEAGADAFA